MIVLRHIHDRHAIDRFLFNLIGVLSLIVVCGGFLLVASYAGHYLVPGK